MPRGFATEMVCDTCPDNLIIGTVSGVDDWASVEQAMHEHVAENPGHKFWPRHAEKPEDPV